MIFTIGYGHKQIDEFIEKLKENKIKVLVDVRTHPFSRWNPKFSRPSLEAELAKHSIQYLYRGHNLGGLGENVDFEVTIDEVVALSSIRETCMMCTEGDYRKCHRYQILTPAFENKGVKVEHLIWTKSKNLSLF